MTVPAAVLPAASVIVVAGVNVKAAGPPAAMLAQPVPAQVPPTVATIVAPVTPSVLEANAALVLFVPT